MPDEKPRIAVRLEPKVYEVLVRLAKLTGASRGAFVSELLDEMYPSLCRTVSLLEAAADAPAEVKRGMAAAIGAVEGDISEAAGDFSAESFASLEAAIRGDSTPVPVTRGSGTEDQGVTGDQEGES